MRNLAHVPLEKLEAESSRLSMKWYAEGRMRGGMKFYRRHYGNNRAANLLYVKIRRIVQSSVGEDWDGVYSKICALTKYTAYDSTWIREDNVVIPFWSYRNQRWEFSNWRHSFWVHDLASYIENFKGRYSNNPEYFYYVCPVSNIIRMVKSNAWVKERSSDFWRRHYKFIKDRRKNKKKEKVPEAVYRMINNPELFKFYNTIKDEYKYNFKILKEGMKQVPSRKNRKNYWERWTALSHNDKFTKAQLKIESLKNQIEDLEAGNFNAFFESAVYLYVQQKECHHFEQP